MNRVGAGQDWTASTTLDRTAGNRSWELKFLFHYRGGPACSWSCQWLGQRWASCPDSGSPSSAARPPSIVCGRRHAAQRRQVI